MRVLFVGEGKLDIGRDERGTDPHPAGGSVTVLAQRICPLITDPLALRWIDLARFDRKVRHAGFAAKVAAAIALSAGKFGCAGTVCVLDRDRKGERQRELEEGRERGLRAIGNQSHPVVCALAVESVEAWTLGAQTALMEVLRIPAEDLHAEYKVSGVEGLFEHSGHQERHPKGILERIAQRRGWDDCTQFREEVALRTDIEALKRACPLGFKPFAEGISAAFGGNPGV